MTLTLSIQDETTAGGQHRAGPFRFDTATLTIREIIRTRVQQEVERLNRADFETRLEERQTLVPPEETERILNGPRRQRSFLEWEKQYAKALAAFNGNGLLVLVNGRQITDLDETIHLTPQTEITFLKLVPLVGG